jgi:queuine/archaeosine tRNA-ribosyltransferase
MLAARLLSFHNLAMFAQLMHDAREAIAAGRWAAFRDGITTATVTTKDREAAG